MVTLLSLLISFCSAQQPIVRMQPVRPPVDMKTIEVPKDTSKPVGSYIYDDRMHSTGLNIDENFEKERIIEDQKKAYMADLIDLCKLKVMNKVQLLGVSISGDLIGGIDPRAPQDVVISGIGYDQRSQLVPIGGVCRNRELVNY